MNQAEIEERLDFAIQRLLASDLQLLALDVNERSITHKLATYLQIAFPDYDVDCEYNRCFDEIKTLHVPADNVSWDDTQAKTVFPDIIVHHRNTDINILVVEVKKLNGGNEAFDFIKLQAFRGELGYQHAVFLRFRTGPQNPGVDEVQFIGN
jgi:hypothetical protein